MRRSAAGSVRLVWAQFLCCLFVWHDTTNENFPHFETSRLMRILIWDCFFFCCHSSQLIFHYSQHTGLVGVFLRVLHFESTGSLWISSARRLNNVIADYHQHWSINLLDIICVGISLEYVFWSSQSRLILNCRRYLCQNQTISILLFFRWLLWFCVWTSIWSCLTDFTCLEFSWSELIWSTKSARNRSRRHQFWRSLWSSSSPRRKFNQMCCFNRFGGWTHSMLTWERN